MVILLHKNINWVFFESKNDMIVLPRYINSGRGFMNNQDLKEYIIKLLKLDKLAEEYKKQFNLSEFAIRLYDDNKAVALIMNNGETKSKLDEIFQDIERKVSLIMNLTYVKKTLNPSYICKIDDDIFGDNSTVTYSLYLEEESI